MEQVTTYTVKARNAPGLWVFKYHLNGALSRFEVLDGNLTQKQINWFFHDGNFPATETAMKTVWIPKGKANFEITMSLPELTFENLWNLYGNKVLRVKAEQAFKKIKPADVIKCFLAIPGYNRYLARKNTAKAHLSTFINKQYYEDDWQKAA